MTNNCPHNTPDEIYNIIEEVHDWRTISSRLMLVLKVIEKDKAALTRKVFLKMYAIYDGWEPFEQSSQIPSEVFAEACTYTMVWDTDKNYEKMIEPISADYGDFDCDLFYDWDSPDLPAEVIKNACLMLYVDEVQLVEDLIEHYGSLEEINYEDLPKSLKPLFETSITKYNRYIKFNGYPKAVT